MSRRSRIREIGDNATQHTDGIQGDATERTWLRKHGSID